MKNLIKYSNENNDHTISIAFLDINMPEMSGFELANHLRDLYRLYPRLKCPVIAAVTAQENVM